MSNSKKICVHRWSIPKEIVKYREIISTFIALCLVVIVYLKQHKNDQRRQSHRVQIQLLLGMPVSDYFDNVNCRRKTYLSGVGSTITQEGDYELNVSVEMHIHAKRNVFLHCSLFWMMAILCLAASGSSHPDLFWLMCLDLEK